MHLLLTELPDKQIEQIAAYHFQAMLARDEARRTHGDPHKEAALMRSVFRLAPEKAVDFVGLSEREMRTIGVRQQDALQVASAALARGDISFVAGDVEDHLAVFRLNLDTKSSAFRELGMAVLKQHVRGLKALEERHAGRWEDTPPEQEPPCAERGGEQAAREASGGKTLMGALKGWEKAKRPSLGTLREFRYAVDRFVELHDDMPVVKVTRRHVLQFREALQDLPTRRTGTLRTATLPELVKWSKQHPEAERVANSTVNKLLAAVQAVSVWARDNGFIPEDVQWADPFSNMGLEKKPSERESWQVAELNKLFASPVFTQGKRSTASGGEASYWLPLLGLFTGARLGELAPLRTADISTNIATGVVRIAIVEDAALNKSLKTTSSKRRVLVHPELVRLGFLKFVAERREQGGHDAQLFTRLKVGSKGSLGEGWSKWFGRYIRSIGITNRATVFHSFRHSFKDALRAAGVGEDINDALTGHSGGGVGRTYGAKDSERRFGLKRLAEAVSSARFEGLKLPAPG